MARGKHKSATTSRRLAAAQERVAALEQEIANEQAALDVALAEVAAVDSVAADLHHETERRTRETRATVETLTHEADTLYRLRSEIEDLRGRAVDAWERYFSQVVDRSPGRTQLEKVEAAMRLIGVTGGLTSGVHESHGVGLRAEKSQTIAEVRHYEVLQKVRGGRSAGATKPARDSGEVFHAYFIALRAGGLRGPLIERMVAGGVDSDKPPADPTPEQQALIDEADEVGVKLVSVSPDAIDLDIVHTWRPSPFTDPLDGEVDADGVITPPATGHVVTALGAALGDGHLMNGPAPAGDLPRPVPSLAAVQRQSIAKRPVDEVFEAWKDRFIAGAALGVLAGKHGQFFAEGPRHPRPGRAAVTRHLYATAAVAEWSRANRPTPVAEAAVGLASAASYWLPADQTYAFADSEPLDDDARGEIALPFPQVFLAFAEPMRLAPRREAETKDEQRRLHAVTWEMRMMGRDDRDDTHPLWDIASARENLSPDELGGVSPDLLLDTQGARVEGLLLLADSLGRPADEFAWCLAVPGVEGGVLGRFVIPARRTLTAYRDVVDNLTAVTAWADWHDPDTETTIPPGTRLRDALDLMDTPAFKRDAERNGAGVRVLNVRTTLRDDTGPGEPTGRQVAPHVRRGHWRRQRFGPGRREVKRVRIAPVLVNAHRGDVADRVYLLSD